MDLSKIVSIAGKPGLFKVLGSGKNTILVESLTDGKRFPAFTHQRISSLEEISIFTTGEDKPLKEVFKGMYEKFGLDIGFSPKDLSHAELAEKFALAVPDFDTERVYPSDMKKAFNWYKQLADKNLLDFSEPEAKNEEQVDQPLES
ncbi:MAG TPA: DUF5606 domain-containing protein [Bacteroidales bacterium]|nr:DUF5606 domain-containing protein [Bacteroidales bacterium]